MSKTALIKELSKMDSAQLVQIIADAYTAKAEIKDYFEFFLNPDVEKLLDKHKQRIAKELSRTKWGHSKARVTVIKKAVKDFLGFAPGVQAELDMYFLTLATLATTERYVHFTGPQERYVAALTVQIMKYGDDNHVFSDVAERFGRFFDSGTASSRFTRIVKEAMANT